MNKSKELILLSPDQISTKPIHSLFDLNKFQEVQEGFECRILGINQALDNLNYPGKQFEEEELLQFIPEASIFKPGGLMKGLHVPYLHISGIDPERGLKKLIFNLYKQGFKTFCISLRKFNNSSGSSEIVEADFSIYDLYER